jgi:hypothetical protein
VVSALVVYQAKEAPSGMPQINVGYCRAVPSDTPPVKEKRPTVAPRLFQFGMVLRALNAILAGANFLKFEPKGTYRLKIRNDPSRHGGRHPLGQPGTQACAGEVKVCVTTHTDNDTFGGSLSRANPNPSRSVLGHADYIF